MTTIDTITPAQISAVRALNGDAQAVAECVRVIRSAELNAEAPAGAVAYKYADPTEDARWIYDAYEAREIAAEDPSLIVWVTPDR